MYVFQTMNKITEHFIFFFIFKYLFSFIVKFKVFFSIFRMKLMNF